MRGAVDGEPDGLAETSRGARDCLQLRGTDPGRGRRGLRAPGGPVPHVGERPQGVGADRLAVIGGRARHRDQGGVTGPRRVGCGLDAPGRAVPPLGQDGRDGGAVVIADRLAVIRRGAGDPVRSTSAPPAGSGMDWTTQVLPFHASASAVVPELPAWTPTASQEAAAVQDTAVKPAEFAPAGSGAACSAQAVPFQLSASGARRRRYCGSRPRPRRRRWMGTTPRRMYRSGPCG